MSARGRLTLGDLLPEARGAAAARPVSGLAADSRNVTPGELVRIGTFGFVNACT